MILRLHAEAERAADELQAIERERRRRWRRPGSSFTDLNQRDDEATQRYDAARFALNLSLHRQPPNEGAEGTLSAITAKAHEEQRIHSAPATDSTSAEHSAQVIPFRRRSEGDSWEPTPEQRARGYLRPVDLAEALGVSRATVDKNLKAHAAEIGANKTSDGRMAHWHIALDAPQKLKKKLSEKGV